MTHPPPHQLMPSSSQLRWSRATMRGSLQHERQDRPSNGITNMNWTLRQLSCCASQVGTYLPCWVALPSSAHCTPPSLQTIRSLEERQTFEEGLFSIPAAYGGVKLASRPGTTVNGRFETPGQGGKRIQPIHPESQAHRIPCPPLLRSDLNGLNSGLLFIRLHGCRPSP